MARRYRRSRIKFSAKEKRAFWVGYGRRLEQLDCAGKHFNSLSNVERASMNSGGDRATKWCKKFK